MFVIKSVCYKKCFKSVCYVKCLLWKVFAMESVLTADITEAGRAGAASVPVLT